MDDYIDEILAEAGVSDDTHTQFAEQTPQRENLRVLAASGQTKECLSKAMSLGDIEKLSEKDVQQFHTRYEAVLAQKMRKNDRWRYADSCCEGARTRATIRWHAPARRASIAGSSSER